LVDPRVSLVADASVAINLNATGYTTEILRALPNKIVITDIVLGELNNGHQNTKADLELIEKFINQDLIEIVQLRDVGENIFAQLVGGTSVESLDDGEAATIAFASENGFIPLIDERKATTICGIRFPELIPACTVDIFSHVEVQEALKGEALENAVFNSLRYARMRVLPRHIDWVLGLIGPERANLCNSLPKAARSSVVSA
jgi:predicted nucleic acid-binding protein